MEVYIDISAASCDEGTAICAELFQAKEVAKAARNKSARFKKSAIGQLAAFSHPQRVGVG